MSAQPPGAIHTTEIRDGVLLAGSDPHWAEHQPTSTATRALIQMTCQLAHEGTLRAVAPVGDLPDFAQISRFEPLGWEQPGSIAKELKIVNARLDEIHKAAGSGVELWRLKGNHCDRWNKRLATVAPEFVGCRGFSLDEQLAAWRPAEVLLEYNPGVKAAPPDYSAAGSGELWRLSLSLQQSIERELLDEKEAAHYLGLLVATLRRYRYGIGGRTDGPRVIKIGQTVYPLSDLRRFQNAHSSGSVMPKGGAQ